MFEIFRLLEIMFEIEMFEFVDFSINGVSTGALFKDVNITTDSQHRTKLK